MNDQTKDRVGYMIIALLWIGVIVGLCAFLFSRPVHSAEADYCRPYAAQLSQKLIRYIWNRLYTTCLNSDQRPTPPVDDNSAWALIFGRHFDKPDISTKGLADEPAGGPINPPADNAWIGQCQRNFKTWRASDQTVITFFSDHKRVRCPCPDHCDIK